MLGRCFWPTPARSWLLRTPAISSRDYSNGRRPKSVFGARGIHAATKSKNFTEGRAAAHSRLAGLPSLSAAVEQATTPYKRPKLKITDVRTAEVRVHGYPVHVRVYTDQGIVGQGESTDAAAGNVPLIRSFARMLMGQDPLNIESAFERIRTSGVFAGAQAGQYVTGLTGLEIAPG